MAVAAEAERVEELERGFRRAGLPMFVEGFSASTDVFNRALPLLGLVFIVELLGAGQLDWTWWQNLLAIAGALLVIIVLLSFTTEELWDMFGKMAAFDYFAVIGLFFALGTAFLIVRVPREA